MPQLLQHAGDSPPGSSWTARLPDGRLGLAVRIPGAGQSGLDRARRLGAIHDPRLTPVVGAVARGSELWVISELDGGISLREALSVGLPSPAAAVQVGLAMLAGLAVLHHAGATHGCLGAENVRVLPEGAVRLSCFGLTSLPGPVNPSAGDMAADLHAAGAIVCQALGIPVGMAPASPLTPLEATRPALAAAARRIASPGSGTGVLTALGAHGLLEEAAGVLAEKEARINGQTELSRHVVAFLTGTAPPEPPPPPAPMPVPPVGQPSVAAVTAPLVAAATEAAGGIRDLASGAASAAAGAAPRLKEQVESLVETPRFPGGPTGGGAAAPRRSDEGPGRWLLMAALGALALVPVVVIAANLANAGSRPPSASLTPRHTTTPGGQAHSTPPATPSQAPTPAATPAGFGPAAAPPITSVVLTLQGGCQPGSSCDLHVRVNMHGLASDGPVAWTFKMVDCSGNVTSGPSDSVNAQAGWIYVYGDRQVQLPTGGAQIVAVTTAPAQAASAPVMAGSCSGAPSG